MNIFTDVCTLFMRSADSWNRVLLRGVHFRQRVEKVNDNGRLSLVTVTTVTVPARISTPIAPGDVLILGNVQDIPEGGTIATLQRENDTFCTVKSVADNRNRAHLKHRKVVAV